MMDIALLGNPNTGKTSLFNNLTGSYEYVGNWSGVTVEKKVGQFKYNGANLIDLPGVYSINPISKDEGVVTRFLLNETFDKIINIVDASQLMRNMHLTIQLMEMDKPIVIGLNMVDVAEKRGIRINAEILSEKLGIPVIPIMARSGKGCEELAKFVLESPPLTNGDIVQYGEEIEDAARMLAELLQGKSPHSPKWLAIQLLEGNNDVKMYLENCLSKEQLKQFIAKNSKSIKERYNGISPQAYIFQKREEAIKKLLEEAGVQTSYSKATLTEKIDQIVTHKWLGLPIFFLMLYLLFMFTFDWLGFPLSDALDVFISGPLSSWIGSFLTFVGASQFIHDLVLEGIVAGVGGVLVFVPQIFILFFFISLLEDSGYMARAAFIMDRLMEKAGLNGKAFIPMVIGFGCNVPAVMAARTIEMPRERLMTILLAPLMSCSARLPIYALFVGAFFARHKSLVVLSLYILGIALALLLAKIFSKTILKGETSYFVIELPPYRVPQGKALWKSTWDKGKGFLKKAGTFIFAGSVIIWLLSYTGFSGTDVNMDESFLAMIGGILAPILAPLGFGNWEAGAALLTGFLAKEAVISTMGIIYFAPNEAGMESMLSNYFTPLQAYSFLVFVLLYIPCLATVATIRKEAGSAKWTVFAVIYSLVIAYVLSFVIYQGGNLLGFA